MSTSMRNEKMSSDGASHDAATSPGAAAPNLLSGIEGPCSSTCKRFWSFHSFRHGLSWVLCIVVLANTWCRSTLSMAMVCMVNATAVAKPHIGYNWSSTADKHDVKVCQGASANRSDDYGGEIVWTSTQQGLLFSALYWGSVLMFLPGSWLINRIGSKRTVFYCQLGTLFSTMIIPVATLNAGLWATFAARFFMGFGGEIVLNTAITVIMSQWIPPTERSTVLALYTSGNQIAIILAMPVNAALCQNRDFLGGWPAIFYVSGVITTLAVILWQVFVDETPEKSRWLSKNERHYIEKTLQCQNLSTSKETSHIPWRQLLLSNALWSCVATIFATGLINTTLQSYLPTYYKEVHHTDLRANGLFSSVPFLSQLVAKMIFAVCADAMKKKTRISHTAICKGFNTLGTLITPAFLIACAFMDCNRIVWALVFLSLANATYSGIIPGMLTALICFAPAYTGVVNGISRFSAQIGAIIAPYIVGAITREGSEEGWRTVFFVLSGVMVVVGVYFLFCGTVEIQEWAKTVDADHVQPHSESLVRISSMKRELSENDRKISECTAGIRLDLAA